MDGLVLACRDCRHRFPRDVTIGVAVTHSEVEHGHSSVDFDLVVVCRCDREMPHVRSVGERDLFWCEPCRRGRAIRGEPAGGFWGE